MSSRTSSLAGWRVALRLARRDAVRARGRSILVLVMIALPVLAVTAADVVIQTSQVSGVESLDRRLGSAQAQVVVPAAGGKVLQAFDPDDGSTSGGRHRPAPTAEQIDALLGGAPMIEQRRGQVDIGTDKGVGTAEAMEVDLGDPITDGLFELSRGRWPSGPGEVVVNQALLDKGYDIGDPLELASDDTRSPTIVGLARSAELKDAPVAAGPLGSLGLEPGGGDGGTAWLVGGGPVDWSTVEKVNAIGATVLSRAVLEDPPPDSEIPEQIRSWSSGTDDAAIAAVVLIVTMALLEVVLLAGPAFAVSARRQSRSLALMAATGGTPKQSRRVVLAGGVVLGGVAAVLGVLVGLGVAWLALPLVQHFSSEWLGPFDVPWLHLSGVAGFGLASAVLAAVVPAWIASRQDVVAVLAGRRADAPVSLRSPALGAVLVGLGVAGSAYGARTHQNGEFAIAASAVVAVLGMILLVPVVVATLARVSRMLPLAMRYAVRDAARHRTRTVPAVAAVAATVAGVVALGIATSSDEAENVGTYQAMLPMGQAALMAYDDPTDWDRLEQIVHREIPDADVTPVRGVDENLVFDRPGMRAYSVEAQLPGHQGQPLLSGYGSALGASVLVGDAMPTVVPGLTDADLARADRALASGRPVVFTDHAVPDGTVVLRSGWYGSDRGHDLVTLRVPAVFVQPEGRASLSAVLPPALVARLQVHASTVSLLLSGTSISKDQEDNVTEAIAAITPNAGFYVERGYQADSSTLIVQLVLAALGAVLMLGGTLTATFLALSDARPDLATLAAVGASPRRRRWIAASYALVVGFVGAALGAAVGFIPGIAISYPLTKGYDPLVDAHYLDVPWLLVLGLVVGLPLLTALLVGLAARSRLPLVARLE